MGYIGVMENEMETTVVYWGYMGYIGVMENQMETAILYWGYMGYIGVMENKLETTILYCCLSSSEATEASLPVCQPSDW